MLDACNVSVATMHTHRLPQYGLCFVWICIEPTEKLLSTPAGHIAPPLEQTEGDE